MENTIGRPLALTLRGLALLTTLVLAGASAGCEVSDGTDVRSYTDSAGRSCTVDLFDISYTATCDADPTTVVTCTEGQEPAFVLDDDYDFETEIWTLRSCGACIDRAARTTYTDSPSCALVDCETDLDCLHDRYTCMGGICQDLGN